MYSPQVRGTSHPNRKLSLPSYCEKGFGVRFLGHHIIIADIDRPSSIAEQYAAVCGLMTHPLIIQLTMNGRTSF